MLVAGMTVARPSFSHGAPQEKAARVEGLRAAARAECRGLAILGDLHGPQLHIGEPVREPMERVTDQPFVWRTEPGKEDERGVTIDF